MMGDNEMVRWVRSHYVASHLHLSSLHLLLMLICVRFIRIHVRSDVLNTLPEGQAGADRSTRRAPHRGTSVPNYSLLLVLVRGTLWHVYFLLGYSAITTCALIPRAKSIVF